MRGYKMKYKQIVFDIDGTLIDTEYAVLHSLQDTVAHITGKKTEIDSLSFALGITGEDTLNKLGITETSVSLSLWNEYMKKYMGTVCLFESIIDLIEQLTLQGYGLGIVTSKTKDEFAHDFSPFGIDGYFKIVVCADDTDEHKPAPAPLIKYTELANCTKNELLYIGDSAYDMECAMRAGIDFALAGWGANKELKSPVSFATPNEVLKW